MPYTIEVTKMALLQLYASGPLILTNEQVSILLDHFSILTERLELMPKEYAFALRDSRGELVALRRIEQARLKK